MQVCLAMLPQDVIDVIIGMKNELETCDFNSFVEDFTIRIVSMNTRIFPGCSYAQFEYRVHLTYKPTCRSMFADYETIKCCKHYNSATYKPSKGKIIAKLVRDAQHLAFTLENKKTLFKAELLSYKSMIQYKNDVFKLKKIMGSEERFNKLVATYTRNQLV